MGALPQGRPGVPAPLRFSEAEAAVIESQRSLFNSLFVEVPAQNPRHERRRGFVKSVQQLGIEVATMRA